MFIVFLSAFTILLSIWWYKNTSIPDHFPPGPPRYPIVGSLKSMVQKSETSNHKGMIHGIFKIAEHYGNVFGFFIGSQPYVVIADYEIMKEVLKMDKTTGRPNMTPIHEFRPGYWTVGNENIGRQPGILFAQGRY